MQKVNKNIAVFVLVGIFILVGIFSGNMPMQEKYERYITKTASINGNNTEYYYNLIDINSIFLRLTGTKYIKKDPACIKLDNGFLVYEQAYIDDEPMDFLVEKVRELYEFTNAQNIKFVYVAVPEKSYNIKYPAISKDYTSLNYNRFVEKLEENGIPYLNLREKMKQDNIEEEKAFYITDHHWKPQTGFWANRKICEYLNETYGFKYNIDYADIDNYNIETYPNSFLGSAGRKLGRFFTPLGIDDIDIILPKFSTNLTVTNESTKQIKQGTLDYTLIDRDCINADSVYDVNAYSMYANEDMYYQKIVNNLNPNGDKILIIKDSFARTIYPYMALNAGEIHVFDMRDRFKTNRDIVKPIEQYITEINPAYVMIIYSGFIEADKFDLFDEVDL